ncbi:MAG: class I SAM-dependent methyltransferase [Gemmataceae bacterium]|nr:class I SAM-dependent methyltransferase [Gemmataceae bacterium]
MALGWWGWRKAKWRLAWKRQQSEIPISRSVWRNQQSPKDFVVSAGSYSRLAEYWHDVAAAFVPQYGQFLADAAQRFDAPFRSVLDVACGSGLLSGEIGAHAERVVGIDLSDAMIARAQRERPQPKFRFAVADFRSIDVGETFDAAVCGSDSLNYVASRDELAEVFRSVANSLRPGGLFVFDVLNERAFRVMNQVTVEYKIGASGLQQHFFYNPEQRVADCFVTFADGTTEAHRRMPLENTDVEHSARTAGLEALEAFSGAGLMGLRGMASRIFWVLRKPGSARPRL